MNPKTQRIRLVFALIFATAAVCGCASSPPAATPASEEKGGAMPAEAEAPGSIEGAIAELDRAESELQQALGVPAFAQPPKPGAQQPAKAMDQPAAAPPTSSPSPAATAAGDVSAGTRVAQESSGDGCQMACRALAGMNRATGHLCDLSGESDARCESARERVRSAGERVRSQCPSCAGD